MSSSHGYPTWYMVRNGVGWVGEISHHKVKGEIQVGVKRFPPMYKSLQTHVEVSPNVRKSAELRAMETSKVKGERKVDV